jgi:hypothetical protein
LREAIAENRCSGIGSCSPPPTSGPIRAEAYAKPDELRISEPYPFQLRSAQYERHSNIVASVEGWISRRAVENENVFEHVEFAASQQL